MKLRRMLIIVFLTLTLTPIVIVSVLLYQSGYKLAKESYVRNLRESISVQADYIEQTISNDMILDNRFAKQNKMSLLEIDNDESFVGQSDLFKSYQSYLETTGDRIAISLLLDKENNPIYTIGEAKETEIVKTNLPELETLKKNLKTIKLNYLIMILLKQLIKILMNTTTEKKQRNSNHYKGLLRKYRISHPLSY